MSDSINMSETPLSCSENLHLQLCVNDLLHPTEKSETLLEALTATQLDEIERTLNKIKSKKQSSPNQVATATPPVITNPLLMNHDWTKVAAQIAKALANTISSSAVQASKLKLTKPPSSITAKVTGTASDKNPSSSTLATKTTTINTSTIANDSADIVDATEIADIATTETTTTATAASDTVMVTEDDGSITSGPPSPAPITNHELRTEMRDGVEWVSFVYSHHRILRRYSIRTDIEHVDLNQLEESFKIENCVYPRANLPREEYKGNRWAYETECNTLGWKLAYLNTTEIAGKRGLIQRAVDSYRNRYPSMRSRRVARQEKLLKGTLRKRKQRDSEEPEEEERCTSKKPDHDLPKTVSIDDGLGHSKCRIRINVDSVSLDSIDMEFRMANCVYPRAVEINTNSPFASQRQLEEIRCNELAWKLAWLNPKQLANRKSLLQRVLDVYRSKFMPELNPRRKDSLCGTTVLTVDALASRKSKQKMARRKSNDDGESQHSGTTDSLDSCLSPALTDSYHDGKCAYKKTVSLNDLMLPGLTTASCANGLAFEAQSIFESPGDGSDSCRLSISSSSSGSSTESNVSSPNKDPMEIDDASFKDYSSMFDLYTDPSAIYEYDQNEHIKIEKDFTMSDSTMTPLF